MTSPIIFTVALFVHLVSLVVGFGAVVVVDMFGLLWLARRVPLSLVNRVAGVTQRLIWLGWSGLVVSGLVLISKKGFVDNLTLIKLFFVAMLGANGLFLHTIKKRMEALSDDAIMTPDLKRQVGFSSFISQLGWWGAMLIGFIHNNWQQNINWPPHPWYFIIGMAVVFLGIGFLTLPRTSRS